MSSGENARVPDEKALVRAVDETRAVARRVAACPTKSERLARNAERKAVRNEGAVRRVYRYIQGFTRLLRAYSRREYTVIPWGSIILATVALLYFVSPIDLIPDILPGGFIDDVALIAYIVKQIQTDLDAFLAWEARDLSDEG
jgi:uncharacterized membrane protein YkvA (DUF1232 family)